MNSCWYEEFVCLFPFQYVCTCLMANSLGNLLCHVLSVTHTHTQRETHEHIQKQTPQNLKHFYENVIKGNFEATRNCYIQLFQCWRFTSFSSHFLQIILLKFPTFLNHSTKLTKHDDTADFKSCKQHVLWCGTDENVGEEFGVSILFFFIYRLFIKSYK